MAALKHLITEWQTIDVRGEGVPNDHSDKAYDDQIIDRLGDLHERAEGALDRLARVLPRFSIYREKLGTALRKGRGRRDRMGQRRQDRKLSHAVVRTA